MRHVFAPILAVIAAIACAHMSHGCKPAMSPEEVNAAYTAEILACTEKAKTLEESRTCRHAVNRKYGLCNEPWPNLTPCDD